MTIYVVEFTTGEYADRQSCPVKAFTTIEAANKYCEGGIAAYLKKSKQVKHCSSFEYDGRNFDVIDGVDFDWESVELITE